MAPLRRTLSRPWRLALLPLAFLVDARSDAAGGAHQGHVGHPGHGSHPAQGPPGFLDPSSGFHTGHLPGGSSGGGITYNPGIFFGYGVTGPYLYSPPLIVVGGGGFGPAPWPAFPPNFAPPAAAMGNGGLNLPMPPRGVVDPSPRAPAPRSNPAKSKELVEIGDRSFRGHNIKRAEDKYRLAAKADPTSPVPHVHLAQVSLNRGDYSAAADHLRDAVSVSQDGSWLVNAPDIQAIFGEPADFAKQLGRLESHLQAHPGDRDGWFVLGAEIYLSGRAQRAFDVFQRLTDRRPDDALGAFLDASKPRPADDK